jgi:hypothetical protein
MKTVFKKFKLALECYKSSPVLWVITACWVFIFGLLLLEDFEHWGPILSIFFISLIGFFHAPSREEHRRYREKNPYDI